MYRIQSEKKIIELMISIYCKKKHGTTKELCEECKELKNYAFKRLDSCIFQENKGTCKNCKIHCYKPEMKEKIKKVMKFSGPRLIIYNPKGLILHMIMGLKK